MTAQAGALRYATKGIYGNVAYDLGALPGTYDLPEEEPRRKTRDKARSRAKVVVRGENFAENRPGISPLAVVGFLAAAVLVIFMLLAYVSLTEANAETVTLQTQLSDLTDQGKKLEADYKAAFNMTEVSDYAQNVLGMVPVGESNIEHLDIQNQDMAVILDDGATDSGSGSGSVIGFLTSLMSYFK